MDRARCLAVVRADSAALAQAARLGLDAAVPSCPAWCMADLIEHTGRVHRVVTRLMRNREQERHPTSDIPLPESAELVAWFEAGVQELADVLLAVEPEASIWNWSVAPNTAAFWWRRMAQETAVHRWDGQAAYGRPEPIAPDVAIDGIDELLDVFLPTDFARTPPADLGGTVYLRCTDQPASWLATVRGGSVQVRRDAPPGPADTPLATVSATASDLLLLLWRRVASSSPVVQVDGQTDGGATLLARFVALADLG